MTPKLKSNLYLNIFPTFWHYKLFYFLEICPFQALTFTRVLQYSQPPRCVALLCHQVCCVHCQCIYAYCQCNICIYAGLFFHTPVVAFYFIDTTSVVAIWNQSKISIFFRLSWPIGAYFLSRRLWVLNREPVDYWINSVTNTICCFN